MLRSVALVSLVLAVLGVACGSSGPAAPEVQALQSVCGTNFCIEFPASWEVVESTDEFASLRHPLAPDDVVATVGQVNMEGIAAADGKPWPQTPDSVVRSFWAIIDGGGAELATLNPLRDGSIETFGTFAGGRLWYRLAPLEGREALGIEVRGPNSSWASHASVIVGSLQVIGP